MNTQPTPKTDVWEAYCDECYYHMWRLRRKTERGWYDGFHIHTGEEAKGLCEILNKLERERDEAREELSEWRILNGWGGTPEIINDFIKGQQTRIHHAQDLEAELTAVTAQRDRLAELLRSVIDDDGTPISIDRANENLQSLTPNVQGHAPAPTQRGSMDGKGGDK
jgi:hypothetical protein